MKPVNRYTTMTKYTSKKQRAYIKLEIVKYAKTYGIKKTARDFDCSRNSVRSWLHRFNEKDRLGLEDKRQGPQSIPHKMKPEIEQKIVQARIKTPCYGPKRLKLYYDLPVSEKAIARVLKHNKLVQGDDLLANGC